jgi:hypothetical protein
MLHGKRYKRSLPQPGHIFTFPRPSSNKTFSLNCKIWSLRYPVIEYLAAVKKAKYGSIAQEWGGR